MEMDDKTRREVKLKKMILILRDIILVTMGIAFILIAFIYTLDANDAIGDGMKNFRYGIFSFGLLISGVGIILSVYNISHRKRTLRQINRKLSKKNQR